MTLDQQKSILTIALLAAFADGNKDDAEREEIRRIAQSLAGDGGVADLPRIYQDVLLQRTSVQAAVQGLSEPMHRQLAYEMAVCVCDVDGRQTAAEREFLTRLKAALQLGEPQTAAFDQQADALVDVAEKVVPMAVPVASAAAAPRHPVPGGAAHQGARNPPAVRGKRAPPALQRPWRRIWRSPATAASRLSSSSAHSPSVGTPVTPPLPGGSTVALALLLLDT